MWRAMKGSGNKIPAAQHPPEGPPSASLTKCSKDPVSFGRTHGDEGIPSVLYTARSPHPGSPSVYYRMGFWEDVEVAKAAEAKAEASKAAHPNGAGLLVDLQ